MRLFGRKQSESHGNQIHYFTALKGMIGMLRNPEHTTSVFDIEDGLRDSEAYQLCLEYVKSFPEVSAIIDQRYLTAQPDIEKLLTLPEGSLGHAFGHHIVDNGFDPDYFRKVDVKTDLEYVLMRIRQTHDIWHVVTGIDTSRIGELTLKAFELGQMRRPMAAIITAGGVMRFLLKDPEQLADVLRGISLGYRLGLGARPFLAQKWEERWAHPLDGWRQELKVDLSAADPMALEKLKRNPEADL